VLDPDGNPAPGYVVAIDSMCNGCTAADVSIANQDGEYSFTDLPPGGPPRIISVSPKSQDPEKEEKIVTTYYPSSIDRELAQAIKIEGVDLFGYDIKLRTARAHSVQARVIDDEGKPVPKALVSIVKRDVGIATAIRGAFTISLAPAEIPVAEPAETTEDGVFKFNSVMEGNWILRVVGGSPAHVGSAEVKVKDGAVEGVEVRVAPAFDVALQMDWGEASSEKIPAKIPARPAMLVPMETPGLPAFGDFPRGQSPHFQGFAGKYLVAPGTPVPGYYLAAVLVDNHDVLGQVTGLTGSETIKLVFKTDGGSVRGTVEKGVGGSVLLLADSSASAHVGYSALCDASGAFAIGDVAPGEYTAVAIQGQGQNFDWRSPELAIQLASRGKRVRVEASSTAQVELRLESQ
jgi:hypothetical protein